MESVRTYRASRTGQVTSKKIHPAALRRRPRILIESLETRRLLSITPAEYSDIRGMYPQFGLPEDTTQINLIEITPDQLSAPNLQAAIASAASTTLIVVRTSDAQNVITYTSASDELAIDIPFGQGAISIIGYGSQPLTLDADSQCGVVTINGYNSAAVVNLGGMVLTHGMADNGGGISQSYGDLTLTNVTISNNTASNGKGGGIYRGDGTLALTNVAITGNMARSSNQPGDDGGSGGGIWQYGGDVFLTDVVVSGNSASVSNSAMGSGGGSGGGIWQYEGTLTLTNVTISGNSATNGDGGGGIWRYSGTSTFTNVTINGNTATNGHGGGGMMQCAGTSTLMNVAISGNTAFTDQYYGGNGGGIFTSGTTALMNVTISGNTASSHDHYSYYCGNGGGIYGSGSTTTLTNVTVAGNTAEKGGGVYRESGDLRLRNTIVAENTAGSSPDVYQDNTTDAKLSASFCLIGDSSGQAVLRNLVDGNLVGTDDSPIDPQFVNISGSDWTAWDLHLQPTSPAVNAGDNSLIPDGVYVDREGNQRVYGNTVDMGAYESLVGSTAEYADIRRMYPQFALPVNVALINVIEINPDQLTAADLQAAIAAAASTTLPDLIVVHTTDTQNTITYSSPSDQIAIYAFASQASISIVGYGSNPLTLDANSQCGVVAIFGDYYNSSTTIVGLGGMVLTHGRADSGGGLYQYASNLVMTNVTISENASTGNGGGLFQYYGRLVMTDVTITGNSATRGGGMCQYGGTSTLMDVAIRENSVHADVTTWPWLAVAGWGGGLYLDSAISTLTSVTISRNEASNSGGGMRQSGGTSTLTNVTISDNDTSFGSGGGIYNDGTSTLTSATISDNDASFGSGGGIYNDGISTLTNVTIGGNRAGGGGGICNTGTSTLMNVTISGNKATSSLGGIGGGIFNSGASRLMNVTIYGNSAFDIGGGVFQDSGSFLCDNTIIARNTSSNNAALDRPSDVYAKMGTLSGTSNLIGVGGGQRALRNGVHGNLVGTRDHPIDPRFVNARGNDWTTWDLGLQPNSRAINKGNTSLIPIDLQTDLAGNQRIALGRVDIGAYELQELSLAVSAINGGAAQRSMVNKLVVVFPERVTLDDGAVTVLLSNGDAAPDTTVDVTNPSHDQRRYVITFRGDGVIGGSLPDGVYNLVVHGEYVKDKAGSTLSGDYSQRFHRLFGDADGNGTVNAADSRQLQIARSPFGHRLRTIFDFDGNGILTSHDLNEFLQRYGTGPQTSA